MPSGRKPGMPRVPGSGRKVGTPNKTTVLIKEGIEAAYDALGGHAGMIEWAKKHPDIFYQHIAIRLLPRDVTANVIDAGPVNILVAPHELEY